MKRRKLLLTLATAFICFSGSTKINAAKAANITAGKEYTISCVSGTLSNVDISFTLTTTVNLDGTNNALLVGLASSDGTKLTDERFVGAATSTGVFDKNGVALYFQTETPSTIGTKTQSGSNYTYKFRSIDFTAINTSKNVAKLVIIGQKGIEISTSFTIAETKFSVKFGNAETKYLPNATIVAPANPGMTYDINGHKSFSSWLGDDGSTFTAGTKATKDIVYTAQYSANQSHHWQDIAEVPAQLGVAGTKAHQVCSDCGAKRLTSSSTSLCSDTDLVIPALQHTHSYVASFDWSNATNPGDKPSVTIACSGCTDSHSIVASDITVIEKAGSRTAATCDTDGGVTFVASCSFNGVSYSEEHSYVFESRHTLVHHESHEATCKARGNIEYWQCSSCDKKFSDSACQHEITGSVLTPFADHDYDESGVCSVCGKADPSKQSESEGFDFMAFLGCKSSVSGSLLVCLIAALGGAFTIRKKHE